MYKRTFSETSSEASEASSSSSSMTVTVKFLNGDLLVLENVSTNISFREIHDRIFREYKKCSHSRLLSLSFVPPSSSSSSSEEADDDDLAQYQLPWDPNPFSVLMDTNKKWCNRMVRMTDSELDLFAVILPPPPTLLDGFDRCNHMASSPHPQVNADGEITLNFPIGYYKAYSSRGFDLPIEVVNQLIGDLNVLNNPEQAIVVKVKCRIGLEQYVLRLSETGFLRLLDAIVNTFTEMKSLDLSTLCVPYTAKVTEQLKRLNAMHVVNMYLPRPQLRVGPNGQVDWTDENVECMNNYDACLVHHAECNPHMVFGVHVLFDDETREMLPSHVICRSGKEWKTKFSNAVIDFYRLGLISSDHWA